MKQPVNLKEADELATRYETITLEEIDKACKSVVLRHATEVLTGFGYADICNICKVVPYRKDVRGNVHKNCNQCLYTIKCYKQKSYKAIEKAIIPEEILKAYRNRAKVIRRLLKKYSYGKK